MDTDRAEPVGTEAEYRAAVQAALAADDWHRAYQWAKGWIAHGGGAWIVEPWLVYAATSFMMGQPRTAVHSLDLALKHWLHEPGDRAVLRWVRGSIVRTHLADPKTALPDLETALSDAPAWLAERCHVSRDECAKAALTSKKRKASVVAARLFEELPRHPIVTISGTVSA